MTNNIDYSQLYQKKGAAYNTQNLYSGSFYNTPINTENGRLAGNSRRHGDASHEVQQTAIDALIYASHEAGLSTRQTAHILATARIESGFNPDAAAGTTSALGLGQFIKKTGDGDSGYGLNDQNRFDINTQARALVAHTVDNHARVVKRNQDETYIYKYHHDGPGLNVDSGGLDHSIKKVQPYLNNYEEFVTNYAKIHGIDFNTDRKLSYSKKEFLDLQNENPPLGDRLLLAEQSIGSKLDHIDQLRDEIKALDPELKADEIKLLEDSIRADQTAIAQLEIDKNNYIDERLSEKQAELSVINKELTYLKNDNPITAIDESTLNQGIPTRIPELEAQQTALNKEINELTVRKDSMIEQQLVENRAKIAENNQSLEDYSAKNIDPLQNIKDTLADTANTSDESTNADNTSAYQGVDYALSVQNVPLFPAETTAFFHNEQSLVRPKVITEDAETKILQEQLIALKVLDGKADGKFGGGTESAVKEFQRVHLNDTTPDGKVDSEVRLKLEELAQSRLTSEDIAKRVDEEMTKRVADQAAMTKENITLQTENEQLQNAYQTLITNQIALLEQQKIALAKDMATCDQQTKAIEGMEKTLDTPREEGVTPYAAIKDDLSKNNLSLPYTNAEKTLEGKEALSLDKEADIKALQTLLQERHSDLLTKADIDGAMGPTTRKVWAKELGLTDDPNGDTLKGVSQLDKDELTKLVDNRLNNLDSNDLKEALNEVSKEVSADKASLTTQTGDIERTKDSLETKLDPLAKNRPDIEQDTAIDEPKPGPRAFGTPSVTGDKEYDAMVAALYTDDPEKELDKAMDALYESDYGKAWRADIEQTYQQLEQQKALEQAQLEQQRETQQLAQQKKGPSLGR